MSKSNNCNTINISNTPPTRTKRKPNKKDLKANKKNQDFFFKRVSRWTNSSTLQPNDTGFELESSWGQFLCHECPCTTGGVAIMTAADRVRREPHLNEGSRIPGDLLNFYMRALQYRFVSTR